jgi:toxin YoeB
VKLRWSDEAWEDYQYWHVTNIPVWKMIKALIKHTQREPYQGLGRPKRLQFDLKGSWSRRITDKDRLVYRVRRKGRTYYLEILQCRDHYND